MTKLPISCADCFEILEPQPPGKHGACPRQYNDCFTFYICNFFSTRFQLTKFCILPTEFIYVFHVIPTQYVYYFRKRHEFFFFCATETGCVLCATRNENYIIFRLISGLRVRAWFSLRRPTVAGRLLVLANPCGVCGG